MSSKWKLLKISDVAEVIGGGTPSSDKKEYFGGDIPWITPKDLSNYKCRYISSGERSITKQGLQNSSARLVPKNTVLFTSRAPIGYVAIAECDLTTNQGFKNLVLKERQSPEFYYYLLKHNVPLIESRASGSTFKEVSGQVLKDTELLIPNYEEQLFIAELLGKLDSKIELNNQINQTLEAMAQAIFKSWFVDFEPVNAKMAVLQAGGSQAEAELAAMMAISGKTAEQLSAMRTTQAEAYQQLTQTAALFPAAMQDSDLREIPEGWSLKALGDICTFSQGSAFKIEQQGNTEGDYAFIKVSDMNLAGNEVFILNANNFVTKEQKKLMSAKVHNAGSTVFAKIGVALTSNRRRMLASDTIIDNNLMSVSPIHGMSCNNYLYLTLTNLDFNLLVSGTALPYLNVSDLRKIQHIFSSREIISKFESITSALFLHIKNNASQNNSLVNIRDSLLPKLLSGELEV